MIMRPREVAEYMGIGLSTVWYYAKHKENFPKPVKISEKVTCFMKEEIDVFIKEQATKKQKS